MADFLKSALSLASKGFKVFPYWPIKDGECTCHKPVCASGGKHPAIRHFPRLATTDPTIITKWWTDDPNRGIGISPESLLIVDIDGPIGQESLDRLQNEYPPLPPTYRVNSGNTEPDRYQLYYKCPPGLRVKNNPLSTTLPGFIKIDIKSGGGGQVAAPGNLHKCGGFYAWDEALGEPSSREDLTDAPQWLTDALGLVKEDWEPKKSPNAKKAKGKAKKTVAPPPPQKQKKTTYFEPGTDGEILLALQERYPILQVGTRRIMIQKAAQFLILTRKLSAEKSITLLSNHLREFHECYRASLESATTEMEELVHSLQDKLDAGEFTTAINHDKLAAKRQLCSSLQLFFDKLRNAADGDQENQPIRCSSSAYSRLSNEELLFVEALLLRYQYEVFYYQDQEKFGFVESQLLEMMRIRHGKAIGRTKFAELKNKFFGGKRLRGKDRTPVFELCRCIKPARHRGEASIYAPIELPLLNLEELELHNVRTKRELDEERSGNSPRRDTSDVRGSVATTGPEVSVVSEGAVEDVERAGGRPTRPIPERGGHGDILRTAQQNRGLAEAILSSPDKRADECVVLECADSDGKYDAGPDNARFIGEIPDSGRMGGEVPMRKPSICEEPHGSVQENPAPPMQRMPPSQSREGGGGDERETCEVDGRAEEAGIIKLVRYFESEEDETESQTN